jgi:hypothetical protein
VRNQAWFQGRTRPPRRSLPKAEYQKPRVWDLQALEVPQLTAETHVVLRTETVAVSA